MISEILDYSIDNKRKIGTKTPIAIESIILKSLINSEELSLKRLLSFIKGEWGDHKVTVNEFLDYINFNDELDEFDQNIKVINLNIRANLIFNNFIGNLNNYRVENKDMFCKKKSNNPFKYYLFIYIE